MDNAVSPEVLDEVRRVSACIPASVDRHQYSPWMRIGTERNESANPYQTVLRLAAFTAALAWVSIMFLAPQAEARISHRIVVNHSIAGVALGNSLHRVHQKLGRPKAHKTVSGELGTFRIDYYGKLQVSTSGNEVSSVLTRRHSIRTRAGLGVGTTKRRLKRHFPNVDCGYGICRVSNYSGSNQIGKPVTDFRMRHDRVKAVIVGRVID